MRTTNLLLIASLLAWTALVAGCAAPQQATDNGGNNLSKDVEVRLPDCTSPSTANNTYCHPEKANATANDSTRS